MEDGDEVALQGLRRSRDLRFPPLDTTLDGLSWYLEVPPLKLIYNGVLIESKDLRTLRHGFRANAAVVKAVYLHEKSSPFEPD